VSYFFYDAKINDVNPLEKTDYDGGISSIACFAASPLIVNINRDNWQKPIFAQLVISLNLALARLRPGFKEITKWVKSGFMMITPIYAKDSQ
jgi:hypothetical protein